MTAIELQSTPHDEVVTRHDFVVGGAPVGRAHQSSVEAKRLAPPLGRHRLGWRLVDGVASEAPTGRRNELGILQ